MPSKGLEPLTCSLQDYCSTIKLKRHIDYFRTSCGGFEPPSGWLTATYSTLKLARLLFIEKRLRGDSNPWCTHNCFQDNHNKPLCHSALF